MPTPLPPFDLDLLRTFVAIANNGGFTRAAERVGRTQATASLQVQKLEEALGRRLFQREPGRDLLPTPDGEVLLTYARRILRPGDEACARLTEPDLGGKVRVGTPEDFATVHLPDVLARFARAHPRVAPQVNYDFTVNLLDGFSKGQYDLILCKREPQGPGGGVGVWREPLVWAPSPRLVLGGDGGPLPLVLAPVPDVYRKRALAAQDAAGRPWRIVYTSPSLAGLQAAVKAELGVAALSKEMVPPGLVLPGPEHGLPPLPDTAVALYRAPGALSRATELLAEHIVHLLRVQTPKRRARRRAPGRVRQGSEPEARLGRVARLGSGPSQGARLAGGHRRSQPVVGAAALGGRWSAPHRRGQGRHARGALPLKRIAPDRPRSGA